MFHRESTFFSTAMHHASEYILPTACITLIAAGLALAWQLSAKNVASTGRPASDIISGARFENVTAQGYTNGERAWNVTAPRVIADRSAHQLDFQGGINAEITYAGTKRVTFNAPRAQYHDENGRFDAAGPLLITKPGTKPLPRMTSLSALEPLPSPPSHSSG